MLPPSPVTIEALQAGYRACVGCGAFSILPNDPDFVVRCGKCFVEKKSARHCNLCGEYIDDARRNFARARGGECKTCWACSNNKGIGRKNLIKSLSAAES